jgi:hypothetical protein
VSNGEAVAQLARLCGRAGFREALGLLDAAPLPALDSAQLTRVRPFIDTHIAQITSGLLQEAMASDDVQTPASADAYLEARLDFLGELLTDSQQAQIRARFQAETASWR